MSRAVILAAALLASCGSGGDEPASRQPIGGGASCYVTGCSRQVCADDPNILTTCEWLPEYACYASAACERQADGRCDWTRTPALAACIEDARRH